MITYKISRDAPRSDAAVDDLWRLEFRAPIGDYDDVLIWVDNVHVRTAHWIQEQSRKGSNTRHIWCSRCPGIIRAPHEHDALPEERGWLHSEMRDVRIMPMREAV